MRVALIMIACNLLILIAGDGAVKARAQARSCSWPLKPSGLSLLARNASRSGVPVSEAGLTTRQRRGAGGGHQGAGHP